MLTLTLQTALPFVLLPFGLASLWVWRSTPAAQPAHRTGWLLVGSAFTIHGAVLLIHSLVAVAAYVRGPGTRTFDVYLAWTPSLNHARTLQFVAFSLALIAFASRRWRPGGRFVPAVVAVMAAGLAGGLALGWAEGHFHPVRHYGAVASWDAISLVVLLVALLACLMRSRLDRYAWLALTLYAFSLSLNVLLIAALSRRSIPGEWSPRPWTIHAHRLAIALAMAVLVARRLRLARGTRFVHALVEPAAPPRYGP